MCLGFSYGVDLRLRGVIGLVGGLCCCRCWVSFSGCGFALLRVGFAVVMDTDCRLYVGIGLGW